jgi:CO/xanthine dehydrogenase Mo-binding subunit
MGSPTERLPEGLLHLLLVRSQVARARLTSVETSAAAALPGVAVVLTAADLPDGSSVGATRPVLVRDRVEFQGQEVAAVVAESGYLAADAAELVEVLYDVDDPQLDGGLPDSHPDGDGPRPGTVTVSVSQPRWHQAPLETHSCLAVPGEDGRVTVRVPVRDAASFAARLARAAGLDPDRVEVEAGRQPGRPPGLEDLLCPGHVLTVAAALRIGRPVRWVESRAEDLSSAAAVAGFAAHGVLDLKSGGAVSRLSADIAVDEGAFAGGGADLPLLDAWRAAPPYRLGEVAVDIRRVRTSTGPAEADTAALVAVTVLVERLLTLAAADRGMDPLDLRLRTATEGTATALRQAMAGLDREMAGTPPARPGHLRGTGVAVVAAAGSSALACAAVVDLDRGTGEWRVERVAVAHPPGALPTDGRPALVAGVVDGYGLAAMQEMQYDDQGNCMSATFMDYVMPTSYEVPAVSTAETDGESVAPIAVQVLRSLATAATGAAVREAVCAAVGDPRADVARGVLTSAVTWELAKRG